MYSGTPGTGLQLPSADGGPAGFYMIGILAALAVIMLFSALMLPRLLELPHTGVSRICLLIISAAALAAASYGSLANLAAVAALAVPVLFVGEMFRPGTRENLLVQVSGSYAGAILAIMCSLWMMLARQEGGIGVMAICLALIGGAILGSWVLSKRARPIGAFIGGLIGGIVAQPLLPGIAWWPIVVLAMGIGLVVWGLDELARSVGIPAKKTTQAAFGLMPLSAMGVVGYALSLIVL